MSHQYSSAFSHIILTGVSLFCLKKSGFGVSALNYSHCSYLIMLSYSSLGVWRWGNPGYGIQSLRLFNFTTFLQSLLTIPTFTAQLWIKNSKDYTIAYLHFILPLIAFILYISNQNSKDIVVTSSILSCFSICIVSIIYINYWGIVTAVSYFLAFFIIKEKVHDIEVPTQDLYNYALSFFLYFSLCALLE